MRAPGRKFGRNPACKRKKRAPGNKKQFPGHLWNVQEMQTSTICPSTVLPLKGTSNRASGAGREESPGSTFVWFSTAKKAQTPAVPRHGGVLGSLSYKKPHNSRPRDPSQPAPEALLLVHFRGSTIDGHGESRAPNQPPVPEPRLPRADVQPASVILGAWRADCRTPIRLRWRRF